MPFTKTNFPKQMQHLKDDVRERAIEICNNLLNEGYEESKAISQSIVEAERWQQSK